MPQNKKTGKNELLNDYHMLEKMSKDLSGHKKSLNAINKRIAKGMKTDLKYGLIESLDSISIHMDKAQQELDKAKKELKNI